MGMDDISRTGYIVLVVVIVASLTHRSGYRLVLVGRVVVVIRMAITTTTTGMDL